MDNICIPIHLDACALSPGCCDGESCLAPYTQPNYTSLQLDSHLIQHDVLDHVDFHLAAPATKNPRLADTGKPQGKNLKLSRMGIHLSWSLPRFYRSAQASGKKAKSTDKKEDAPNPNPVFRPFPNRWLVTRHLQNWQDENKLKEWQSWIVESDAVRKITEIGDGVDLESDMAPFVSYRGKPDDKNVLKGQTEVFLGQKFDLAGTSAWTESSSREHIAKLTLMHSSNPLFADNALHNTNVLSMLDNFAYPDDKAKNGFSYLQKAKCDYFVIGWHSESEDDPLNQPKKTDLVSRLSDLMLRLNEKLAEDKDIANNESTTRCLVHGAIYDVKYDFKYDPKKAPTSAPVNGSEPEPAAMRNLANEAAHKFTDEVKMEPLSVGITPLDGILTFLEAHKSDADSIFGEGASDLANLLMNIAQLLYATGDNYDSRVQAQDLIAQQNFSKADGGSQWIFAKTTTAGKQPEWPTDLDVKRLAILNEAQSRLDASQRRMSSLQWELFAEWWKGVSKYNFRKDKDAVEAEIAKYVGQLKDDIGKLQVLKDQLNAEVQSNQDKGTCKFTTKDPYHTRIDPTLCIVGLDSGWPSDWQEKLGIRLENELTTEDEIADTIFAKAANPVTRDHGLDKTARRLLQECINNSKTKNGKKVAPRTLGFQTWDNKNPFVPIYIEWEGLYYHVGPFEDEWEVKLRPSPVGHAHHQVRYVPKNVLTKDEKNHKDFRTASGRVLVLPQPVFSLEALVKQVLDSASKDVALTDDDKKRLRDNIRQIQFISAPLSGLTNHLLTRYEGAHVKPNVRRQGERKAKPLTAAIRTAIGMDDKALELVDSESALTPYGDSFPFGKDHYPGNPFKPVTHGQMILTKVNIIDKFGQAVCMPKILRRPRLPPKVPTSTINPCLSDWLTPDAIESQDSNVAGKIMNTVLPSDDPVVPGQWPHCQYIQLTPSINQQARINASFLVRDTERETKTFSRWREATDYDPMIWGWVVINYADNGLQFFLGDGRFYREIRKGGVKGTNVSAKWLPYEPPPPGQEPDDAGIAQLSELIDKLHTDQQYFQEFSDMINGSIKNMPFPPSDYSGYANAIVGKPLALVNVGWSLELAAPATKSQNTLGNIAIDPEGTLKKYNFPLKLGDIERNYDGVVGYWNTNNDAGECKTKWDKMYTYFTINWSHLPAGHVLQLPGTTLPRPTYTVLTGDTLDSIAHKLQLSVQTIKTSNPHIHDASPTATFQPILPDKFLEMHPYYLDPVTTTSNNFLAKKAEQYTVTSLLIDPYTPTHAYSPILPVKHLTLPSWTIQTAFEKMHAFFHLGPLLLTADVPGTRADVAEEVIKLPVSGRKGTWNWFQPYAQDGDPNAVDPRYAQMEVQEDLGDRKFEKAPYTFVEGFLQLMGSLEQKKMAMAAVAGSRG